MKQERKVKILRGLIVTSFGLVAAGAFRRTAPLCRRTKRIHKQHVTVKMYVNVLNVHN